METTLGLQDLHVHEIEALLSEPLRLHPEAIQRIEHCREYLDRKMEESDRLYYGINTGFGSLCNIRIPKEHIGLLQHNLVVSHACGLGAEVPQEIVRIMLLLKIKNFTYGHSGVSMTLVQRLVDMYNQRAHPVVYELGSLGASGDLAPLAHLSLPLLGEGEVWMGTERLTGAALNQRMKWPVLELQSKEGLALLNGTQFMNAYAIASLLHTHRLLQWADAIAALSFDAFDCTLQPFSASIHRVRAHRGQVNVAQNMQQWLQNSELAVQPKSQVQDPYSFRCIPQVHGASRDAADAVTRVVEQELNSVTDNPMIFPEEDSIVSGGNFHGQPLAIHLDFLAIAVAELASISERRTYLLISGQRNLPPFLSEEAGTDSGFMIAQYTAASIVSRNKHLCHPASVDSIVSSNGQEDHVSMGANAATKLYEVVENTERVLAIELLCAAQAMDFRRPGKSSPQLETILKAFREKVPHMKRDRILHHDMISAIRFLREYRLP